MDRLRISIVTPSFNRRLYLERCIDSVLEQDYPNFEHIVIDGASHDGTVDLLRQYKHVKWVSEPDKGQSQAINKGFVMATGDILAWLNSDDEYLPGAFSTVAEATAETRGQAVIVGGVKLYLNDSFLRMMPNHSHSFFRFLNPWIPYTNISQPGVFLPRSVWEKIGSLNEELFYVMDYDLLCRILKNKIPLVTVPKTLAKYNLHDNCKTGRGWHVIYPELDRLILDYARRLEGVKKGLFYASFMLLRPAIRGFSRVMFPPIY